MVAAVIGRIAAGDLFQANIARRLDIAATGPIDAFAVFEALAAAPFRKWSFQQRAGAADELTQAILVNPHDIDGTKAAIVRAVRMPRDERRRRMRALRRRVSEHDVERWAADFLGALDAERARP